MDGLDIGCVCRVSCLYASDIFGEYWKLKRFALMSHSWICFAYAFLLLVVITALLVAADSWMYVGPFGGEEGVVVPDEGPWRRRKDSTAHGSENGCTSTKSHY